MTDSSRGDNTAALVVPVLCDLSGGDDSTCLNVIAVVDVVGFSFRSDHSDQFPELTHQMRSLCLYLDKFSLNFLFVIYFCFLWKLIHGLCVLLKKHTAHK